MGRFLSVDPAPVSVHLGAPQSWNRYSYVQNNPMNRIDPFGRKMECVTTENGEECTVTQDPPKRRPRPFLEIRFTYLERAIREQLSAKPPPQHSPQAQPPNDQQCDQLSALAAAEKENGTFGAALQHSTTLGSGMPSFNNDAGGVYENIVLSSGAELDVDWFTDLVMFTGGGGAGGATTYAYGLGKSVWSAGNRGQSGYPFPFQDPGEPTALAYAAQGFRYVDVLNMTNCGKN
jgi:hypothetical protein